MSLRVRKIILWSVVIILAVVLLFFWFRNLPERMADFRGDKFIEGLELPEIELPKMEIPEEEIKEKVEEMIQEAEEENSK